MNDGGSPANGSYDLTFTLFDAATSGNQVGGTVTNLAVGVTNGLFTTTIDFGPGFFTGANYWLQIGVETNGAGGHYTLLSALQPLMPVPYAMYSTSAGYASSAGTAASSTYAYYATTATTANGVSTGSVTGSDIASGQVVKSLNGLADAVTLSPGANVTITPSGNTLTIASTAGTGGGGGNGWSLTGNNGTSPAGGYFLGTLDDQPLELRVNGQRALRLEPDISGFNSPNVIAGASNNVVASGAIGATIGGGSANINSGLYNGGIYATIGGGQLNNVSDAYDTVSGGGGNNASGFAATVGGGELNTNSGDYAAIGGGEYNNASGTYSMVGGGLHNITSGYGSTVGGGWVNTNSGDYATIGGGHGNNAGGTYATVGGGWGNNAEAYYSTIGGGAYNTASSNQATVCGGLNNVASGNYATVVGGNQNTASGNYSLAAGLYAHAVNQGAFVWADSQNAFFYSTANDQFCIRAQGGVQLDPGTSLFCGSNSRQMLNLYGTAYGIGVQTGTMFFRSDGGFANSGDFSWFRGGTWNNGQNNPGGGGQEMMRLDHNGNLSVLHSITANVVLQTSDRSLKSNFTPVNPQAVLAKVSALPITAWTYKNEAGVQHLGPMAQDFYAAFNVGSDDKHITTIDEGGVALAAIQGLNQKLEQKETEITELKQRLEKLEQLMSQNTGGAK